MPHGSSLLIDISIQQAIERSTVTPRTYTQIRISHTMKHFRNGTLTRWFCTMTECRKSTSNWGNIRSRSHAFAQSTETVLDCALLYYHLTGNGGKVPPQHAICGLLMDVLSNLLWLVSIEVRHQLCAQHSVQERHVGKHAELPKVQSDTEAGSTVIAVYEPL